MFNSSDNLAYEQHNSRQQQSLLQKYETALHAAKIVLKNYGVVLYVDKLKGDIHDDEDNLRWALRELNKGFE